MINAIYTTPPVYVQNNLYDILKDDFDSNGENSSLFLYLFENYEKKELRSDGKIDDNIRSIINHIRPIIENENFSFPKDLKSLHQQLTIYETKKDKIYQSDSFKRGYKTNQEFPVVLRYLNYKIDHLKCINKKKSKPDVKKKINAEDIDFSKKELLELLEYYERCDTFSRCYDYLFRMKKKTTTQNSTLQLIQFLYEQNRLSPYDLFKAVEKKNISDVYTRLPENIKREKSFLIPLLTDPMTNTALVMIQEPRRKYMCRTGRRKPDVGKIIENATITKNTGFWKNPKNEDNDLILTFSIFQWNCRGATPTEYTLQYELVEIPFDDNLSSTFNDACNDSLEAIKKYNTSLENLPKEYRNFINFYLPQNTFLDSQTEDINHQNTTAKYNSEVTGDYVITPSANSR